MKRFLEKNFPPGYAYSTECKAVAAALILGVLSSLIGFFSAYSKERQALYIRRGMDLILDESRVMPDFVFILDDSLVSLFILAGLILVAASIIHYAYHYSGSKSIYLMRRLSNGFELHRRSLLIPLLFALSFALMAFVLLLIYYAVYMNLTPKVCLTPGQWQKIWRMFL